MRRAKVALADGNCQYRWGGREDLEGLDDAAAEHVIVSIKHSGLPWA